MVIIYKDDSLLMRVLGKVLFFNPAFMISYATTIGETIYLPNNSKNWSDESLEVLLAHEMVHVLDYKKEGVLFALKYLFPQILIPIFFLIFPFSIMAAIFLFIFFALPLPAYWRMKYELRGYTITLATKVLQLKKEGYSEEDIRGIIESKINKIDTSYFKGSAYYFMWPFGIYNKIKKDVNSIISSDIFSSDEVYEEVRKQVLSKYHWR
jgi:ABC-type multidrug transport system fused ATPase/permease subunit